MTITFESAIVRIHNTDGSIVGAGFLVTDRHILTCAHVVADALGLPYDTADSPDTNLHLDFPLVAPGQMLNAHIIHWQPTTDIAGLELADTPPDKAEPVHLVTTNDLWGHAFRAHGFPPGYDQGVWASGVLRGRQADGWVQIEDVKQTGYFVAPGFSGGPVWDEQLNGVVGMVVAADTQPKLKAAFMIPANLLIEVWTELAQRSLDVNSLAYLQEQLASFEAARQNAPDPHRFDAKIDELKYTIATWEGRVETQRQRIAAGLAEQRKQLAEVAKQQRDQKRLAVVGRRPLGTVEYFKNRRREQETIGQLLAEPATRLVSVIGHGGMGKTALASKVLRDLEQHRWPHTDEDIPLDGIVYLSTRTAGISLERLFLDCAKMLGGDIEKKLNATWTNPKLATEDKISDLIEALKNGLYVVLLDNMEDLLGDSGRLINEDLQLFFDQSLTTAHGARLLVTSRLTLAFKREVMRFDQQVKLLEGLPVADGVALLRELDPNGDYGLKDAPEEQLAQAVELAHGVPRALEVMAGILANDPFASLTEVIEKFYQQEDVVQALIEENYKRLDSNARRVIEGLSVFKRPVPPLAIDYLLEPFVPGLDAPGIIRGLTRTNIVSIDRTTKTIILHPIDQDYAYSQLSEDGDEEPAYTRQALERRAANYYIQLRTPPDTWQTIDDLAPQLTEFEHRIRAGDYDEACQLIELIDYDYLLLWGHYGRLIEMREMLRGSVKATSLQVSNLGRLGRAYHIVGQYKRAIDLYQQAVDIAQQIDDRSAESTWLSNIGNTYYALGEVEKAIKTQKQALAVARAINNQRSEAGCLGRLGIAYHGLGQVTQAISFFEDAIEIADKIGDLRYKGVWLGHLGTAYRSLGQVERAIELHQQSLDIAQEIGDRRWEGVQLGSSGTAHFEMGQFKEAINFQKQALEIAREIGDRRAEEDHLGNLGRNYHRLGNSEQAIKFYNEALAIASEIGDRRGEEQHLDSIGRIYRSLGNVMEAIDLHKMALEIAREIGDRTGEGQHFGRLGVAYRELGQLEQAISYYEKALAIAREIGDRRKEGRHLGDLGSGYRRLGNFEQAIEYHEQAVMITRETKDRRDEGMWLNSLGLEYAALEQYDKAQEYFNEALLIARGTNDNQRASHSLLGLGKIALTKGNLLEAKQYLSDAIALSGPRVGYQAALNLGIVLLQQQDPAAQDAFGDAVTRSYAILEKTAGSYEPRYALATALVGRAVCESNWMVEVNRSELLAPALAQYQRVHEICTAPGVVQEAVRDLELIRAAGVNGLEPVFELLEAAKDRSDE